MFIKAGGLLQTASSYPVFSPALRWVSSLHRIWRSRTKRTGRGIPLQAISHSVFPIFVVSGISLSWRASIMAYRYNWSDRYYVGVMAQEVADIIPDAVVRGPDGYLRVDYGRVGLQLMTWDEWLARRHEGTSNKDGLLPIPLRRNHPRPIAERALGYVLMGISPCHPLAVARRSIKLLLTFSETITCPVLLPGVST